MLKLLSKINKKKEDTAENKEIKKQVKFASEKIESDNDSNDEMEQIEDNIEIGENNENLQSKSNIYYNTNKTKLIKININCDFR